MLTLASMDPSNQQMARTRLETAAPAAFLASNSGRLLLLALSGFLAIRLALALLHLS